MSAAGVRLVLSGRVQGVGFRWYVARAARELPVRGWVRNLPDGRVELLMAGEPEAVGQLGEAALRGPYLARVDNVEKSNIPHDIVLPKAFEIR